MSATPDPLPTTNVLNQALGALAESRPEVAAEILKDQLWRDPSNASAYAALGIALAQLGDTQGAIEAMERAHYQDPYNPRVLYNYGLVLQSAGRSAEARLRFSAALKLDPLYERAWRRLALLDGVQSPSLKDGTETHNPVNGFHPKDGEFTSDEPAAVLRGFPSGSSRSADRADILPPAGTTSLEPERTVASPQDSHSLSADPTAPPQGQFESVGRSPNESVPSESIPRESVPTDVPPTSNVCSRSTSPSTSVEHDPAEAPRHSVTHFKTRPLRLSRASIVLASLAALVPILLVVSRLGPLGVEDPVSRELSRRGYRRGELTGLDMSGMRLSGAHLERERLQGTRLSGADLRRAQLRHAQLERADLSDANLQEADLRDATLDSASLVGTQLDRANLSKAQLRKAYLKAINGRSANLEGADLAGAFLAHANLSGAQLRSANLFRANLQSTSLRSASLEGADVRDADFRYAELEGVVLRKTRYSPGTRWPLGFKPQSRGALLVAH